MGQITSVRLLILTILFVTSLVLGQDPDPVVKEACTQFKRSVFEERVPFSHFFANAPISWETIDSCDGSRPLIVGGSPADPKEFPHIARLGNRNATDNTTKWFCGGTLISNRLVLTAAHCLYSENGEVNVVRLGELDFSTDKDDADPEDFGVKAPIEHPDFNYQMLYNDIALLQLDRIVNFNFYKHPACLPFKTGAASKTFIAIGWGDKKFAGRPSEELRKVQLNNFGNRCSTIDVDELPNGYNSSTQICIGSSERKDTCSGDSGGPLLNYHEEYPCMYHVMGITSFGTGCGTPNVPSIYTLVHFYLDWIKKEMAKNN
ncbi:GH18677 [Drosophila grimshawi]|uniref:GH18677 n=2 Tax=Drosophila grimshawi TaxID=7222 RepID=B4JH23_DROGR|nr:GH18677 [Drosophila grimshawi]